MNIVLLDMLNTPFLGQAYARAQMLKFLAALPSGETIALFALRDRLNMIQGYTADSDALIAAAKSLLASNATSHLLTTDAEHQSTEGTAANADAAMGGTPSGSGMGAAIMRELAREENYQENTRSAITVESLQALARSVAGYPGRKNLLWLSSEFPLRLGPDFNQENQARFFVSHKDMVLETAALLTSSQIAVYPIDVGGLATRGPDIGAPSSMGGGGIGSHAQTLGAWYGEGTMNDIARETGGEAFYNTNDLSGALARGLRAGTNYYTLAYVPSNSDWSGKYRKIEVKAGDSVQLRYRHGYYAVRGKEPSADRAASMLALALQPMAPESTMLTLRVQVLPPDAEHKSVRVDYAVDARDIQFSDASGSRKHAVVDFMLAAWDSDQKDAGHIYQTTEVALRPETYEKVLQTGFPAHQEVELKPGKYRLRLGAIDRQSQRVGTVDVPLIVEAPAGEEKEKEKE